MLVSKNEYALLTLDSRTGYYRVLVRVLEEGNTVGLRAALLLSQCAEDAAIVEEDRQIGVFRWADVRGLEIMRNDGAGAWESLVHYPRLAALPIDTLLDLKNEYGIGECGTRAELESAIARFENAGGGRELDDQFTD